jgi:hypothetical protein
MMLDLVKNKPVLTRKLDSVIESNACNQYHTVSMHWYGALLPLTAAILRRGTVGGVYDVVLLL